MSAHPLRRRDDVPAINRRARTFLSEARTLPPVSSEQVDNHSHTALVAVFPGPHARKLAAKGAACNPKAAKNWVARENGLSLTAFVNLCRQVPEFRAYALPFLGADQTEDIERLLTEAINGIVRQRHETKEVLDR